MFIVRINPIFATVLCLIFDGVQGWCNLLSPQASPERLVADIQTVALFEWAPDAVKKGYLPDLSGHASTCKLVGKWEYASQQEIEPAYHGAAKSLSAGNKADPAHALIEGITALQNGPFSVDILWRSAVAGGIGFQVGGSGSNSPPLQIGLLHRGPGMLEMRIPVKKESGQIKIDSVSSATIYQTPGVEPLRFDDFYTTSFVFDGNKTFSVFIDSRRVFEYTVQDGDIQLNAKSLVIGDIGSGLSHFRGGAIAAVRVSQGVRNYAPHDVTTAVFSSAAKHGLTFDAGPKDSPLSPGAIALSAAEMYVSQRQYGWLQKPLGEFDSWYSPGRFDYAPKHALAKKTHKIHDALMRDGVVLPDGDLFRADLADGVYWVTVGLGDSWNPSTVNAISANGIELGSDLRMRPIIFRSNTPHRLVRGLVRAENGHGILIAGQSAAKEGVPIQSISILPYVPSPVVWNGHQLQWQGTGSAPDSLGEITRLLANDDFASAAKASDRITDPLIRASTLACVLGKPHLPDSNDLMIAREIRQLLIGILRNDPDNALARWLFDSTERYRHAVIGYQDDRGTEVAYGAKESVLVNAANQVVTIRPEDPEYWQAHFLAGAAIWQIGVQYSAFGDYSDIYLPQRGPESFAAPGKIFREVIAAWPQFRIARIMLGEKLPVTSTWKGPRNAPQWATLQYELLTRVMDTIHYWVNERQDEKGLLGGGLGDDVEALRWWGPGVTLADDKLTIQGFKRLSETAWQSTQGKGFALTLQDVEHSAEDMSDSQPMRALTDFGTPEFNEAIRRLTIMKPVFRDIWTGVDPSGHRMFKGHYLSATEVAREGDVPYNLRAIRPLLWGMWASQGTDRDLDSLVVAYARSWRDGIMAQMDDKPRGIVPMMICWGHEKSKLPQSDGHINTPTNWVFPGYWSYTYPQGYAEHVYDLLIAGYELSGEKSLLDPITFALQAFAGISDNDLDPAKYPQGSYDWALRSGAYMIGMAGANYRALTGDKTFDDVLLRIGPPHCQFMILASRAKNQNDYAAAVLPVIKKLRLDLAEMNTNPEMRTSMVQSTDRIYVCGSQIIDAMATGVTTSPNDLRGGEVLWPTYQITWQGTSGQLAAMIERASPQELIVQMYSFADRPLKLHPRVWRLEPGNYLLIIEEIDSSDMKPKREIMRREVKIESRGQQIAFEFSEQVPARLSLTKK